MPWIVARSTTLSFSWVDWRTVWRWKIVNFILLPSTTGKQLKTENMPSLCCFIYSLILLPHPVPKELHQVPSLSSRPHHGLLGARPGMIPLQRHFRNASTSLTAVSLDAPVMPPHMMHRGPPPGPGASECLHHME